MTEKTAIIAMSGGVDSSVAAFIMKQRGYKCIGATMKLFDNEDSEIGNGHTCCSLDDTQDAKSVALSLKIPHYVFNFKHQFKEKVVERFIADYETGKTPNPCVYCNKYLKFDKLYIRAQELDYNYLVTGHYARIEKDVGSGRYILKKAVDTDKDQSYVLYSMTQQQLAHTRFPLGDIKKQEVREIAKEQGFINAKKHESQDICFVPDGDYAGFIERYTKKSYPTGNFVDLKGRILGEHRGIIHYTIGQRKGLGVSFLQPMYVCKINPLDNTVVLGTDKELYSKTLTANDINLISVAQIDKPVRLKVKVRYRQKEQWATVVQTDSDKLKIEFDRPQRAITRGQAVVLYDGDTVVGGGTIC